MNTTTSPSVSRKPSSAEESKLMREERLGAMSQNLPAEHYALYSVLEKKHPFQMARIIAQKFEQFYPDEPGLHDKVLSRLYPGFAKKQPIAFPKVNRRLASLEHIFDEDSPCLELVESLRQIFQILPKPGNKYRKERTIDQKDADECFPSEKIEPHKCRLCWRTVWRYPIENGIPLCSFHKFKSADSEYKRRKRLAKEAFHLFSAIDFLCGKAQCEIQKEHSPKLTNEGYALLTCSILPYVSGFLATEVERNPLKYDFVNLEQEISDFFTKRNSVSLGDIPPSMHLEHMHTHTPPGAKLIRTIIDILDPAVNLSGSLAQAREQFVLDMTWNFAAYISYIYEAEAWLMAENESKHGGSRKHVGENL